ncbi:diguanylate cyclase [Vibrio maritimus]|uniref:Diguanylate cyclase n=1 Tax=Vibrio maritimus TaxID=990268 RepID=A0A090SZR0_9VIBR|nr:diguanylate cyclase [Vibrio maritimus]
MPTIPSTIPFIRRNELHPILEQAFSGCERYICILIAIENHQAISSFCGERTRTELVEQMFIRFENRLKPTYRLFQISDNKLVCVAPIDSDTADDVIQIVDGCFSKPIVCENSPMIWLSRMGGASVFPDDAQDGAALLSCAESALQYAQKQGGSRIQRFSHQIREHTNRFQLVYQRLCSAIEMNTIDLWFQPMYDPFSKQVTICEALARWHDEILGVVSPDEFILVAEVSGLIKPLSEKLFSNL